jgi:hypothetical protein
MEPESSSGTVTLIAVLGLAGAALIGCLASALGPLLIPVVLAVGGLALLGGFHYWLWGQAAGEQGEQERDTEHRL